MSEVYQNILFYTLGLQDKIFVHQYVVDSYAAQTANDQTKPITLLFALAGLYLFCEKKYTGRQVQQAHQVMASGPKNWPQISLPSYRGAYQLEDVWAALPGSARQQAIEQWAVLVWAAYVEQQPLVRSVTEVLLAPKKSF
jgi:hypothetical protein